MAPHYSRQCFADAISRAKREAYRPRPLVLRPNRGPARCLPDSGLKHHQVRSVGPRGPQPGPMAQI